MPRYIREEMINKPNDFVDFIIADFLQKHNFHLNNLDGEMIYQEGSGMLSMPRFFKYRYVNGVIHLEAWTRTAWLPGVYGKKENDLHGYYGSVPKTAYRKDIDNLIDVLYQPLPSDYSYGAPNSYYGQPGMNQNPYAGQQGMDQNPYAGQPGMNQNAYYGQPGMYQNQPNMYDSLYAAQNGPIVVKGVDTKNLAVIGLIFALLSIPVSFVNGFMGMLIAAIATAYSYKGIRSSKKGLSIVGLVFGIIGIIVAAIAILWLFFGN